MLCKLIAMGNIAGDVDFREQGEGRSVADMMVECEVGQGKYRETVRIPVRSFNRKAEFCMKYLHHGTPIIFEGTFHTQDGGFYVTASSITFASAKKDR